MHSGTRPRSSLFTLSLLLGAGVASDHKAPVTSLAGGAALSRDALQQISAAALKVHFSKRTDGLQRRQETREGPRDREKVRHEGTVHR